MLNYSLVKTLHIVGVFMLISSIVIICYSDSNRFVARVTGNVAMFVILITGLALTVLLHIGFPFWVQVKLAIWLLLTIAVLFVSAKKLRLPTVFYLIVLLVVSGATFLAILKPG
ncbi:MAG: hypothetical protein DF168_00327 [Candidatus Moanabacter tarae]|uniref:Uncharacterized protein n=1 Tax=Candidatus Moanibacter tarae TaxID=2200854 RepID=A0A2Z4AGT6_9BACT|nr:MAG: hypothetical protein DF168_00327 [Candidatus Moanabacter tarae]|tara:strand:+ start:282 stop:623 length:342 start_codon:yes stop_codon:yes gene_type:complete